MSQLKTFEEVLGNPAHPEREAIETMWAPLRAQIALAQKEQLELRLQETELSNVLSAEQGRWLDFNSRLDELEHALPSGAR